MSSSFDSSNINLAVVGLGYVGLPLAVEFAKKFSVVGYDISANRVAELSAGTDSTLEVTSEELDKVKTNVVYSSSLQDLAVCNMYVVTVPTPITRHKQPDLSPLIDVSRELGEVLKAGDIVIYESTVYPGATEEVCVPILERLSGLALNEGFYVGYSPERINPGDKTHRLTSIKKVTSGSTPEVAEFIDELYSEIVTAGTYRASSIKVAEAAKVIENTQRDLNIALINELSKIFNLLDIDTEEVLEAAGTKWNFLPFRPGLVGGHCIGVDPYYLTHKAGELGYHPEVILAGRRINDGMGQYVASQLVKAMLTRSLPVNGAKVLVMGLAFKENCPDLRNTKIVDVIAELQEYNVQVDIFDPWVDAVAAQREYGISLVTEPLADEYDGIILAVAHEQFKVMGEQVIRALGKPQHVLYDLKYILPKDASDIRL